MEWTLVVKWPNAEASSGIVNATNALNAFIKGMSNPNIEGGVTRWGLEEAEISLKLRSS